MQTEAYDFLKTGRIDRFDTLSRAEFDLWQQVYKVFSAQAETAAQDAGVKANYNSRCLAADDVGGKRTYSFETWGEFSDIWAQTVRDGEWTNLQRLDFRIECDIDPSKLPGFAHYVEKNGKYSRNVSTFSSREREKKEGRHAGGKGCSIGSHKSDRRLVAYKRKGERGAIELQMSGNALRSLVEVAFGKVAKGEPTTMYREMRQAMGAALEKMARESGFESAYALVRSLTETAEEFSPPDDFLVEAPVQMMLQGFAALPSEQKRDALRQMNALYLGDEPAGA